MNPLAIDLFCGLGGWTEGLLAEGYDVVGFDIERHVYGDDKYPAQLVLQDVLMLHGSQFKDAALIVASPPCQAYSYRAMPWKKAKALGPPCNDLFDACFRIQREAIEAAGHHIPTVVENVKGAQPWVGRSRWNFGSFHLWGDVPALMPMARARKNDGGSWFAVAHNKGIPHNPVGHWTNPAENGGFKSRGLNWSDQSRRGQDFTRVAGNQSAGIKHHGSGAVWWDTGPATFSSKSDSRKRASAMIAKIPLPLSRHIAAVWKP